MIDMFDQENRCREMMRLKYKINSERILGIYQTKRHPYPSQWYSARFNALLLLFFPLPPLASRTSTEIHFSWSNANIITRSRPFWPTLPSRTPQTICLSLCLPREVKEPNLARNVYKSTKSQTSEKKCWTWMNWLIFPLRPNFLFKGFLDLGLSF